MFYFLGIHFRKLLWLLWPLRFLLHITVQPQAFSKDKFAQATQNKDTIFILPRMSLIDIFVLNVVLKRLNIAKVITEALPNTLWKSSILAIKPPVRITPFESNDAAFSKQLIDIIDYDSRVKNNQIALYPVSVFWGRVPERIERNMFLKLLFPDDGNANTLQKIWIVLLHCRNIHIHFGNVIDINALNNTENKLTTKETANRIRRQLLIEFKQERIAALGPSLYDFSSIADQIISSPATQELLNNCAEGFVKGQKKAIDCLAEIAANYNYLTVTAFERVLDFVWTRIFSGVRVRNFDKIAPYAKQGQILWMPCHRSHLDYLLLSYLVKKRGLVVPHIAAGVNLNFWPAGSVFRRSGAFFLRRSFQGNKIYSHVFSQYVDFLMQNNFGIEFFQEGGRTRIGKLLTPKRGMLSICIASMVKRRAENTFIVPVYFGYEKVLEEDSYARELMGAKKSKESAFQFVLSLRKLFSNYGIVDVSFGTPIKFGEVWTDFFTAKPEANIPSLLKDIPDNLDNRLPCMHELGKFLATRVNEEINVAATASGSALLSSVLLASAETVIFKDTAISRLKLLHWIVAEIRNKLGWNIATSAGVENSKDFLLSSQKASNTSTATDSKKIEVVVLPFNNSEDLNKVVENILEDAKNWKLIVESDTNNKNINDGELISYAKNVQKEMHLWWYRGTIFHILAVPGMVATILLDLTSNNRNVSTVEWWLDSLRNLWSTELYWPKHATSASIAQTGLYLLQELAIINIDNVGNITISDNDAALDLLYFFCDIIRPEREIYGLQITTALAHKRGFVKPQIIPQSTKAHHKAFLRGAAIHPASLSEVFGNRVFDALAHCDIFIQDVDNKFIVNVAKLNPILDFFETPVWQDFVVH